MKSIIRHHLKLHMWQPATYRDRHIAKEEGQITASTVGRSVMVKVAPYQSMERGEENHRTEKHKSSKCDDIGILIRRTLMIFGGLSGEAGGVKTEVLKQVSVVYHIVMCLMHLTNVAVSLLVAWDKAGESIQSIMVKMAFICLYVTGAFCSVVGLIISHWQGGLPNYLENLSATTKAMERNGIKIDHKRINKFNVRTFGICMVLGIFNISVKVLDYVGIAPIDAVYGAGLRLRIENDSTWLLLRVFGLIMSPLSGWLWVLGPLLLINTCHTVEALFKDYNRYLENVMIYRHDNPPQRYKLQELRLTYSKLRELVQHADAWVSVYSVGVIGVCVTSSLMSIYGMAKAEQSTMEELLVYTYWTGACVSILIIVIIYAQKLFSEVRAIISGT